MTKQTNTHTCLKDDSDQAHAVQYTPQTGHTFNKISTYVHRGLKELTGSFEMEILKCSFERSLFADACQNSTEFLPILTI
ncbi:unnamed protein product [Brassica rapa subsp. narinosa]|uniref:Uncharacterized protein n=1 Tax=Brassica campestris TaxID=3711 RepID=M4DPV0_BRACM